MTYNVFSGTLNPTQSILFLLLHLLLLVNLLPCAIFSYVQFLRVCCLLACNEDTVPCVQTLDADYSKNPDAVLGILCQMLSGKSFELIHSAAAVTGKLPVFAAEFIKSVRYCHRLS